MGSHRQVTVTIAALFIAACAASVEATPIQGSFSISGNFLPVFGATGAVTGLESATGIDFIDLIGSTPTPGTDGQFVVNSGNGDFGSLAGQHGTVKDFTFSGAGSLTFPNTPLIAFEHVGGVTFDLLSAAIALQTSNFLVLSGTGIFNLAGFDPTAGTFSFSGNGAGGTFSFSASNGATAAVVPEPTVLLRLGAGLFVVAAGLRRRWSKQA